MTKIEPKLSGGFRDYLPEDMIPRQKMFDIIQKTFENFGFVPLDTPGIEREEILTGGDPNFKKQIFRVGLQGGDDELALRFDLTVPLARVIAANYPNKIKLPFKRYQIGKAWRGERPQAGRYREFTQCDIDIIGSASMMADAEIIALMFETLSALGLSDFLIRINNRKILNGLVQVASLAPEKLSNVLRIIDKLDKQGWNAVQKELMTEEKNDQGAGLSQKQVAIIKDFLDLKNNNAESLLDVAEKMMNGSLIAEEGIKELRQIIINLKALNIPDKNWTIDLSLARGLGYYTGPVFETILTNLPEIGSVFSGGRYDGLVSRFSNNNIPATGTALGVDRLFAAMEKLNLIERLKTNTQVMILSFDQTCENDYQEMATKLRRAKIATEVYLGKEQGLKEQLTYALKQEIPILLIMGSDEKEKGTVQIKDTRNRQQIEVRQENIITEVMKALK